MLDRRSLIIGLAASLMLPAIDALAAAKDKGAGKSSDKSGNNGGSNNGGGNNGGGNNGGSNNGGGNNGGSNNGGTNNGGGKSDARQDARDGSSSHRHSVPEIAT